MNWFWKVLRLGRILVYCYMMILKVYCLGKKDDKYIYAACHYKQGTIEYLRKLGLSLKYEKTEWNIMRNTVTVILSQI